MRAGGRNAPEDEPNKNTETSPRTARRVLFANGASNTAIYERAALPAGMRIDGPAIIEQSDTTTLIPPHWSAANEAGNTLILTRTVTEQPHA